MLAVSERRGEVELLLGPAGIHPRAVATGGLDQVCDPGTGGQSIDPGRPDRTDDLDHEVRSGSRHIRCRRAGVTQGERRTAIHPGDTAAAARGQDECNDRARDSGARDRCDLRDGRRAGSLRRGGRLLRPTVVGRRRLGTRHGGLAVGSIVAPRRAGRDADSPTPRDAGATSDAAGRRATSATAAVAHPGIAPSRPISCVPPAMPDPAVAAWREDVDAVGAPRRGRRRAGQLAAHRLPVVPRRPVPVAVPELAVVEDREDLQLVDGPRGRGGCRRQLPAERGWLGPAVPIERSMDDDRSARP